MVKLPASTASPLRIQLITYRRHVLHHYCIFIN